MEKVASPDVLHNCWTCTHARHRATVCEAGRTERGAQEIMARGAWVARTHRGGTGPRECPEDADGCPSWEEAPGAEPAPAQEERDAAEEGLALAERDLARARAHAEELRASIRRQGEELDRVHVALADALRTVHRLTAPGPLRRIARRLVSLVTP